MHPEPTLWHLVDNRVQCLKPTLGLSVQQPCFSDPLTTRRSPFGARQPWSKNPCLNSTLGHKATTVVRHPHAFSLACSSTASSSLSQRTPIPLCLPPGSSENDKCLPHKETRASIGYTIYLQSFSPIRTKSLISGVDNHDFIPRFTTTRRRPPLRHSLNSQSLAKA